MEMRAGTRVIIVEDNQLTRLGLEALFVMQPDLELVGEAFDGAKGVSLYEQLRPDVAIVDLRLPVFDGVQVTAALRRFDPAARIIILTHYDGDENVFRALRAGALGYLTKESPGEEIIAAIKQVASGNRYLPPAIAAQLAERTQFSELTARERQILEHVAKGDNSREIATRLGIAERTITTHTSNLMEKLGARNRTEAIRIAKQRGILSSS